MSSKDEAALIQRPQSLTRIAYDRLREGIMSGEFGLGEPLSEQVLARRFGISKTPIREALVKLHSEGLIKTAASRGSTVFTLTAEEIAQLVQMREVLESFALRLAYDRNKGMLAMSLGEIAAQMRRSIDAGDFQAYQRLDGVFHDTIIRLSGNAFLIASYGLIGPKIGALRSRTQGPASPDRLALSFADHAAIADRLARAEYSIAVSVLNQHIERTSDIYRRVTAPSAEPAKN